MPWRQQSAGWRKEGVGSAGETAHFPSSSLQRCLFPRRLSPLRSLLWIPWCSFLTTATQVPTTIYQKILGDRSLFWNFLEIAIQHNLQWLLGDSGTQGFSALEFLLLSRSRLSYVALMLNVTKHLCIKYHNNHRTSVPVLDTRKPRVHNSLIKI